MADNEIIKALENIMNEKIGCCKEDCNFYNGKVHGCAQTIAKHSLDLIKRQKAEIERLSKQVELGNEYIESLTKAFNDRTAELQTAKLDIKQLHTDVERIENRRIKDCRSWQSKYSSLRAEAVKEFAEIYTEKLIALFNLEYSQAETARRIKKIIVKEMVGEK